MKQQVDRGVKRVYMAHKPNVAMASLNNIFYRDIRAFAPFVKKLLEQP